MRHAIATDRAQPDPIASTLAEVLRPVLHEIIRDALAEHAAAEPMRPVLFTKTQTAQILNTSISGINNMMRDGCPFVRLGESPRFELPAVLEWLRGRGR